MTFRHPKIAAIAISCLLPATMAFAQSANRSAAPSNQPGQADAAFLRTMAQSNEAEIQFGQLAQQKSTNTEIQNFGKQLVSDHTQLNNQVKQVASNMNMALPSTPAPAEMRQIEHLRGMTGKAFDRAFIDYMLSDHRVDVKNVQREAETAMDPAAKNLAAQALPVLENHLRIAENLAGQLGIKPGKGENQSNRMNPGYR